MMAKPRRSGTGRGTDKRSYQAIVLASLSESRCTCSTCRHTRECRSFPTYICSIGLSYDEVDDY